MPETKGFDLAGLLKGVSNLDTAEQIVRLPLDRIDPDPENFYSLDGLDELAGNIETVGLLDPIRVRPNGERFTVVSGHRRRAACLLIRDSGSEQFQDGVPCIVEYGEASDAMRKLRLIYANSATRQLTSAEQSRQAEEVTRLLYELKEQGVQFPGRMRDHVAQACKLTRSKIARLHAIRANLDEVLLALYDRGELVEDVAYQLSRFPKEIQTALGDRFADGKKHKMPIGSTVDAVYRDLDGLQKPMRCRAHAGGPDCHHGTDRVVRSLLQPYSWAICDAGTCCLDCYKSREGCTGACREARDRAKLDKAVEEEKEAERRKKADSDQEILKTRIRKRCLELLPYCIAAKLGEDKRISSDYRSATVAQIRKWASGDMEGEHFYSDECVRPSWSKDAAEMARRLGCSLELALGLPEKTERHPGPASRPSSWQTGTPKKKGWYVVKMTFHGRALDQPRVLWSGEDGWYLAGGGASTIDRAYQVTKWLPLPKEET